VKCDERHPLCRNCAVGNRHCEYVSAVQRHARVNERSGGVGSPQNRLPQTDLSSYGVTSRSPGTTDANVRGQQGHSSLAAGADFTATHMQIFYHANSTIASQMAIEGDGSSMIKVALDNASIAPYVLDQMLALSALHYSTTAESLYAQQATELQIRALTASTKHEANRAQT
jgi:hypothetical protein